MRSFFALLCLLYVSNYVVAKPMGRLGHAYPKTVNTGSEDSSPFVRRRLGYAGGPKVVTPPGGSDKRGLGRQKGHHYSLVARGRAAAKRDLNSRLPARTVHLPLHQASQFGDRSKLHPAMYFQQKLNQAHRRYARYLGHIVSDQDLVERLQKRAESVDIDFGIFNLRKRGQNLNHLKRATAKGKQGDQNQTKDTAEPSALDEGFSQLDLDALIQNKISKAESPTAKNSVGLDIEANDIGYFANVKLGTPGKTFAILMDSGSADFWVSAEKCANSDTKANTCAHTGLGAKTSSSFKASNQPFSVTYGTGNVQGVLVKDNMALADLDLKAHSFGACSAESDDFANENVPFDGLMGLAQSSLSNQGVLTPIEALTKAGTVQASQMGFALGRVSDGANIGQITFGGVDKTKFTGDLTLFNNVNKQGFWEGAMDDITVNGKSLNLKGRTAILDTGTTLIIAPPADAEAVHAQIEGAKSDGQGGFTVPCGTTAKVALTFGGKSFVIESSDLAVQPISNDLNGDCISGISSGQIGGAQQWLVGDVFLKSVYFATDVENNQIGLATAAGVKGVKKGGQDKGGNTGDASNTGDKGGNAKGAAADAGATGNDAGIASTA